MHTSTHSRLPTLAHDQRAAARREARPELQLRSTTRPPRTSCAALHDLRSARPRTSRAPTTPPYGYIMVPLRKTAHRLALHDQQRSEPARSVPRRSRFRFASMAARCATLVGLGGDLQFNAQRINPAGKQARPAASPSPLANDDSQSAREHALKSISALTRPFARLVENRVKKLARF